MTSSFVVIRLGVHLVMFDLSWVQSDVNQVGLYIQNLILVREDRIRRRLFGAWDFKNFYYIQKLSKTGIQPLQSILS